MLNKYKNFTSYEFLYWQRNRKPISFETNNTLHGFGYRIGFLLQCRQILIGISKQDQQTWSMKSLFHRFVYRLLDQSKLFWIGPKKTFQYWIYQCSKNFGLSETNWASPKKYGPVQNRFGTVERQGIYYF